MTETVRRYLSRRGLAVNPLPEDVPGSVSVGAVCIVIPVRNEYPGILDTLHSIADSAVFARQRCGTDTPLRIICVVNNRAQDTGTVIENNRRCLDLLRCHGTGNALPVPVEVIDCVSAGRELPPDQGVGFARKAGMDYALAGDAAVLACLDADTTVSSGYVEQLLLFARNVCPSGRDCRVAVTDFIHRLPDDRFNRQAIQWYEQYMKRHSRKLAQCGTWFYPSALGPVIVCTAEAYAACGGMNLRQAGEDFYFLQSLIKVCGGPPMVLDCCVYPSPRVSRRVPFGTGQRVAALIEYAVAVEQGQPVPEPVEINGYPDDVYAAITMFMQIAEDACRIRYTGKEFRELLEQQNPALTAFLQKENFFEVWFRLLTNNKTAATLGRAFQCWFDGLKIIRCIHFLSCPETTGSGNPADVSG